MIPAGDSRICLNMIVRNEAEIIEACLRSLLPAIDTWVICDTGSTDGTPRKIEAFFAEHGVRGLLAHRPFVDFGTTRNEALELCRAWDEPFDYILLVDADMELVVHDPRFRATLTAPAYLVRQSNAISYYNTRMVRRDVDARYVGATHEYLSLPSAGARLDALSFVDHACGSSRGEKYVRDERLLLADLERDPANPRAMYYLAQTYRDMGDHAKAARWFGARADAGGFAEEAWFARYSLALCHRRMGDDRAYVDGMLEAHRARPWRAEPMHELARFHRERGDSQRAAEYAFEAKKIAYPSDDLLFVDSFAHRDGARNELSISGFYSRDPAIRAEARRCCLELAHDRETPAWCRGSARSNWVHYARRLEELLDGGFESAPIDLACPEPYAPTNPSIAADGDGLRAVVRKVNYRIADGGRYEFPPGDRFIRTRNSFASLDRAGRVLSSVEMVDRAASTRFPSTVLGFEDCRLVRWRAAWWCTATVRDRSPDGRCEIALLRIDEDGAIAAVEVLRSYGAQFQQKNWLPFVREGRLFFIYGTDPTIVLEYRGEGDLVEASTAFSPLALDHLRGGAAPVRVGDEWLYLAHSVEVEGAAARRTYLHSFVRLSNDFSVVAVSEPFYFESRGVEFAAGLAVDEATRRVWVSYGVADRIAKLSTFDLDALLGADIWLDATPLARLNPPGA